VVEVYNRIKYSEKLSSRGDERKKYRTKLSYHVKDKNLSNKLEKRGL